MAGPRIVAPIADGSLANSSQIAQIFAELNTIYAGGAGSSYDVMGTYGAKGDGVTDDYPAFQAAINAAVAAGGGTVLLRPGTYLLGTTPVVNGDNVIITGAGRASVLKAKAATSVNCLKLVGNHLIVSRIAVDGNKTNVNQVGVGTQYIALNGIWVTGCTDVLVEGCYIHDCYAGGVLCDSSSDLIIRGNRIKGCYDNGIFLRPANPAPQTPCSNATIQANIVSGGGFSGIQAIRSSFLAITGNVSYSNGPSAGQGDGIGVEGCDHFTIAGNTVHDNGIMGVNVRFTSEGTGGNLMSTHGVVVGNTSYGHTSTNGDAGGISLSDCDDILVASNHVHGNYTGIQVTNVTMTGVSNLHLDSNDVRSNTSKGIRIWAGAGPFLLTNNNVSGNGDDNLYTKLKVIVQGGVYSGALNSKEGMRIDTGADGSIIEGCLIADNTDNGILVVSPVANVEIRNCVFDNAATAQARALFEASGAGPTRLVGNRIRSQRTADFAFNNASSVARGNDSKSGFYDVNSGTATITAAGASVTVTHGLYKTPTRVEITMTGDAGSAVRVWVSAKGATTFVINASPAVTNDTTFDWRAYTWDG